MSCGTNTITIPRLRRYAGRGALAVHARCNLFEEHHDLAACPICVPSSVASVACGTSRNAKGIGQPVWLLSRIESDAPVWVRLFRRGANQLTSSCNTANTATAAPVCLVRRRARARTHSCRLRDRLHEPAPWQPLVLVPSRARSRRVWPLRPRLSWASADDSEWPRCFRAQKARPPLSLQAWRRTGPASCRSLVNTGRRQRSISMQQIQSCILQAIAECS